MKIEDRGLLPLVSAPLRATGPPGFQREDFAHDAGSGCFAGPGGQRLRHVGFRGGQRRYRAGIKMCRACAYWWICTTNLQGRQLLISPAEPRGQANWERVHSEEARLMMMIRRQSGERPFGYF